MDSRRRSFYKSYGRSSSKKTETTSKSSTMKKEKKEKGLKTDAILSEVARKLSFQTPKKQTIKRTHDIEENDQDGKENTKRKYKPKPPETVVSSEIDKISAQCSSESPFQILTVGYEEKQIYAGLETPKKNIIVDLTNEDETIKFKCPRTKLQKTYIDKELKIFKEIQRQHEIEEACKQIRQESFLDTLDETDIDIENIKQTIFDTPEKVLDGLALKKEIYYLPDNNIPSFEVDCGLKNTTVNVSTNFLDVDENNIKKIKKVKNEPKLNKPEDNLPLIAENPPKLQTKEIISETKNSKDDFNKDNNIMPKNSEIDPPSLQTDKIKPETTIIKQKPSKNNTPEIDKTKKKPESKIIKQKPSKKNTAESDETNLLQPQTEEILSGTENFKDIMLNIAEIDPPPLQTDEIIPETKIIKPKPSKYNTTEIGKTNSLQPQTEEILSGRKQYADDNIMPKIAEIDPLLHKDEIEPETKTIKQKSSKHNVQEIDETDSLPENKNPDQNFKEKIMNGTDIVMENKVDNDSKQRKFELSETHPENETKKTKMEHVDNKDGDMKKEQMLMISINKEKNNAKPDLNWENISENKTVDELEDVTMNEPIPVEQSDDIETGNNIKNNDVSKEIQNNTEELNLVQELDKAKTTDKQNKDGKQNLKQLNYDKYVRSKQLRQQKRQKYVDFLSDNEDFVWSSSSWEGASESDALESKSGKKKRKSKKKIAKTDKLLNKSDNNTEKEPSETFTSRKIKKKNVRKENTEKKNSGIEYKTNKGKIMPAKSVLLNPCNPDNCPYKCYEITEERRLNLFGHYWSLDNIRRKDWLVAHSKKDPTKRKKIPKELSRRKFSLQYFVNEGEGQRQVCLKFLTKTLDIRQRTLYNIVSSAVYGCAKEDGRGKHVPSNKTPREVTENLHKYIQELPALPSHYCRKNNTKTYLPQEFKNVTNLYRLYKDAQEKGGLGYVGEKIFKKVFLSEFNIGFHQPKKDKCLKCTQFENNEGCNPDEKEKHLKDKKETYDRFEAHQEIYKKDDAVLCTSFDLQKVLNTPHGDNMMLYYSRKLAVYNLTFYESGTRNGFCYTWNETDGKRGANEIASILQKYIKKVDERETVKHLLLYCDSCPGQNKNKMILACINETLIGCNNLISIQINYLLPGHTYMPVDSIHSVIEKSIQGVTIWAPSQWPTVFTMARKNVKPYEVEILTHSDFFKWDSISETYFKGKLAGKISKLRTVTFKKSSSNKAFIKYSMHPDATTEAIEIINKKDSSQIKPCYKTMQSVSKKKYTDLIKLCTTKVIPTAYHSEYQKLTYTNNIEDTLNETDTEDEIDTET